VRIGFHRSERRVLVAEGQRLRLGAQARRGHGCVEEGSAINPLNAVSYPEPQRVARAELDSAKRIGDAEIIERKDVRRGLVEAPVGQRDAWIDRLKFAFEIE
jgi:hypothetical protein